MGKTENYFKATRYLQSQTASRVPSRKSILRTVVVKLDHYPNAECLAAKTGILNTNTCLGVHRGNPIFIP